MIGCITSRKYSRGFYIFTIIIDIDTIVQSLTFDSLLIRTLVKFYRLDTIYGSVSEGAVDGRDMGQVVNRTRRGNGGGRLHIDGQIKRRKNDPQTSPTLRHPRRRIPVILASFFFPRKIGLNTTTDFEIIISKESL